MATNRINKRYYRFTCPHCHERSDIPMEQVDPKPRKGWYRVATDCTWPVSIAYHGGMRQSGYDDKSIRTQWREIRPYAPLTWWDAPSDRIEEWLPALLKILAAHNLRIIHNHQDRLWRIKVKHRPTVNRYGKLELKDGKLRWVQTHSATLPSGRNYR